MQVLGRIKNIIAQGEYDFENFRDKHRVSFNPNSVFFLRIAMKEFKSCRGLYFSMYTDLGSKKISYYLRILTAILMIHMLPPSLPPSLPPVIPLSIAAFLKTFFKYRMKNQVYWWGTETLRSFSICALSTHDTMMMVPPVSPHSFVFEKKFQMSHEISYLGRARKTSYEKALKNK